MVQSHEKFFPGVPIVFCGGSEDMLEKLKPDSSFTGVWGVVQPKETLTSALRLQPGTKHVVVVGGVGTYDRYLEEIVKQSLRNYESRLEFTYLTDLDMPTLLRRLGQLPSNTVVLYTSIFQDAAGTRFIDANQSSPAVINASNAPVFVLFDVNLGTGAVGGDIISFASDGNVAGQMAVRVLDGEQPQNISVVKNADIWTFDWRALRRWGFKERDLPPGSIVLDRQPALWESYKWYIIAVFSLIILESLLIVGLLWQRGRRKQAEGELRIMFERLHLAIEAGSVGGWDYDLKTGKDVWFGKAHVQLGMTPDETLGSRKEFWDRVHEDDRERVEHALQVAKEKHEDFGEDVRVVWRDGTTHWLRSRGRFHYAANGEPERSVGISLDITERKRAEEALLRYAAIVESFEDPILSVTLDGVIVTWNAGAQRMFGYTENEAVGKPVTIIVPPELPDEENKILETLRAGGRIEQFETVRVTKTGKRIDISLNISPIQDSTGKTVGYAGIERDITKRKRAEQALLSSEQRYRLLFERNVAGVAIGSLDGRVLDCNEGWARILGYESRGEVLGRHASEFLFQSRGTRVALGRAARETGGI